MARVNRALEHTLERFERLMKKTYSKVYNFAYRLVRNSSDAEDLTQETYYRALRKFDTYDGSKSFENWIFKILGRLFLDLIRHRKRRVKTVSYDAPLPHEHDDIVYFEKPDDSTNPEAQLMKEELSDELERAIKNLTPEQQSIMRMADVEEIPYQEIAERLDAPIGTIRSRLHRTHKTLRKKLAKIRAASRA
ncbi:MAG TPA: sigma-70 family RNA polymerase sigma factor [Fimbriimonadales bacterium]|nr:sigma-70 family RNA polymerase sigma factor [Fimbriimonadales bacterium]